MTKGGKSGKKHPSTDKAAIEFLAKKHPVLKSIVEYRKIEKETSTYLKGFKDLIDPITGRIHGSFLQHTTATGRLSSSSPNLQNIPRSNRIRNMVIPRPGWKFVTADLSQAELRILALLSQDRNMLDAFASGFDFHTMTACMMFGIKIEEFDKDDKQHKEFRNVSKTINFGVAYGRQAFSIAEQLSISVQEAQAFIDKFFRSYPKAKQWLENTARFAEKHGYVETLHGRRRYLPEINSSNSEKRNHARNQAVNTPIQGTASDCACFGLIKIQDYIDQNNMCSLPTLIIHDEICVECPEEEIQDVYEKLPIFMTTNIPKITIPLIAEPEILDRWKK
jgi:DNA polymerase-1